MIALVSSLLMASAVPTWAVHDARFEVEHIVWHSYVAMDSHDPPKELEVTFGRPLHPQATIESRERLEVERNAEGQITKVRTHAYYSMSECSPGASLARFEVRIPMKVKEGPIDFQAPIIAGNKVQRVMLPLAESMIFVPDDRLRLEQHLTNYRAEEEFDDRERACLDGIDRWMGLKPPNSALRIYLGQGPVQELGLTGEMVGAATKLRMAAIAVAGLFVVVLGGLMIGYRQLSRAASRQRAEAILAEEIDRLS